MIHKSELKGKYVSYLDKDGKNRIEKVVAITGNTLTMQNVLKRRRRVEKDAVIGRQMPKKGLEPIDWSVKRKKKREDENGQVK